MVGWFVRQRVDTCCGTYALVLDRCTKPCVLYVYNSSHPGHSSFHRLDMDCREFCGKNVLSVRRSVPPLFVGAADADAHADTMPLALIAFSSRFALTPVSYTVPPRTPNRSQLPSFMARAESSKVRDCFNNWQKNRECAAEFWP